MATISKRVSQITGKVTWRVRIRRTGYPEVSKSFTRKTDAQRWAEQAESNLFNAHSEIALSSKNHLLKDVFRLYEPEILQRLKDPYTRLKHLSFWENELGNTPIRSINANLIRAIRNKLRLRVSDSTTNRYVASLSAALTFAERELEWIDKNPALKLKKLKEPPGRTRFLSNEERAELLNASKSLTKYPEMNVIIILAITTGMRRGEILKLRWVDCDLSSKRIIVRDTKNGETRSVPLVGLSLDALTNWSKVRPTTPKSLIFPAHPNASQSQIFHLDHAWRLIKKDAGLEDFRFHDLRHTAASYLAMSGAGLREIGDILGHKSISMTMRYSHLTDDFKYTAISRMVTTIFGD